MSVASPFPSLLSALSNAATACLPRIASALPCGAWFRTCSKVAVSMLPPPALTPKTELYELVV